MKMMHRDGVCTLGNKWYVGTSGDLYIEVWIIFFGLFKHRYFANEHSLYEIQVCAK